VLFADGGSGLFATTSGESDAGNVTVTVESSELTLNSGAQITASTDAKGDAGFIRIDAEDTVISISGKSADGLSDSRIESTSKGVASGKAGAISIVGGVIDILNGGRIETDTESSDPSAVPADITLNTSTFSMTGGAITAESRG
jgi:hypothetical protein